MAGYQQDNAYQTYQLQPYQAPNQAIVQAIQTRGQYWDAAASQVRNAYQNYLNLDLTRQDNHDKLNDLMQGVTQNLKQATQTDLSLGENYGKALSIFDPIVKDDNIMGDNAITRHYKDQFNVGQQYRIKDNGKGYSDTNMRDLSNHLQDFANDPNAANWRQHYSQRAFYTPYTDVAAEVRQVGKDFKPDTTAMTVPQYMDPTTGKVTNSGGSPTGYLVTQTNKSIIASQYRAFLDAHLSDKAKDQLALEGRVKYHDNIGALAQDYTSQNQEQVNSYNKEITDLTTKRDAAAPGDKDSYNTKINQYQALVKELGIENTKMSAGDFSNLTPYKNQIAAQVYTNRYTDYVAKSSAQTNIDVKYSPDGVWKTMFQEANENKRFNIASDIKWKIANLDNDTKLEIAGLKFNGILGGRGLQGIPDYRTADTSNDEKFGKDKFDEIQKKSGDDFKDAVGQLNQQIKAQSGVDMEDPNVPQAKKDSAHDAFLSDPRNKYDVAQYNMAAQKKASADQTWSAINDSLDKTLAKTAPDAYNYRQNVIKGINQGQSLTLTPKEGGNSLSLNLSADDIKGILAGTNPKYKLGSYQEYENGTFTGPGMGMATPPVTVRTLTYNGKEYKFNYGALAEGLNKMEVGAQDYETKRNSLLNQNVTRMIGYERLYQNDKNPYYNAAHNIALNIIKGSDEKIDDKDVSIAGKDRDGNVYVKVEKPGGNSSNVDISKIEERVKSEGGKYIKAMDAFMIPGSKFGAITAQPRFQDPRLGNIQTLVDFRSGSTPNDTFNTAAQTWGDRNFTFKVDIKNGMPSYRIVDPYTGAVFGKYDSGDPFSTLEDAASRASTLGSLKQEDYINLVRTTGGVPSYTPGK